MDPWDSKETLCVDLPDWLERLAVCARAGAKPVMQDDPMRRCFGFVCENPHVMQPNGICEPEEGECFQIGLTGVQEGRLHPKLETVAGKLFGTTAEDILQRLRTPEGRKSLIGSVVSR